ncbi:hypothetical protein BDEG_28734 [Batrachochytrium dendrobatidis JEL423]|uniref:Uncharacterized protein n=1 Tax=Batrachochytrium dendrobatidis (strain JEL423) TaxID=403673 RepID=A0A177VYH6_BATDL|nr:hypothetical protein BDEG_28734 [Batrachochytrium dendrobatidis JEL423]
MILISKKKICDPLQSEYDSQIMLVMGLGTKLYTLERKSRKNGGSPEYDDKIRKTRLDLKAQEFKLRDIRKSRKECDSKCNGIEAAISHIKMSLVDLIFGESSNYELFEQQIDLINKHPSVVEYLDKLSLEYSEIPGQSSSDQQRQEPQPSSSRPSGSGSSRQKAPSNKRKRVSKLMGNAGSFFQQPKDDDPSV